MNALKQIWAFIKRVCVGYWGFFVFYAWWAMWRAPSKSESFLGFFLLVAPPFLVAMFLVMNFTEPMP